MRSPTNGRASQTPPAVVQEFTYCSRSTRDIKGERRNFTIWVGVPESCQRDDAGWAWKPMKSCTIWGLHADEEGGGLLPKEDTVIKVRNGEYSLGGTTMRGPHTRPGSH